MKGGEGLDRHRQEEVGHGGRMQSTQTPVGAKKKNLFLARTESPSRTEYSAERGGRNQEPLLALHRENCGKGVGIALWPLGFLVCDTYKNCTGGEKGLISL